jgi:2TM domain
MAPPGVGVEQAARARRERAVHRYPNHRTPAAAKHGGEVRASIDAPVGSRPVPAPPTPAVERSVHAATSPQHWRTIRAASIIAQEASRLRSTLGRATKGADMADEDPIRPADDEGQLREAAVRRLKKRRDFEVHLLTYVVVNAVLVAIWYTNGRGDFWPMWVMLFWGVGVVINAWDVFGRREITESDVRREMDKLRGG